MQYKLYNSRDVELLKEKVRQYEAALQTVQLEKKVEQFQPTYLFDKYIDQMNKLERIIQMMKEDREGQMDMFIQHVHHLSNELQSIKGLINELKDEISEVKNNTKHLNEHNLVVLMNDVMKQSQLKQDQQPSNRELNTPNNNAANESDNEHGETPANFRDFRNLLTKSNNLTLSPTMDQRNNQINQFHGRTTIVRNKNRDERNIRKATHPSKKENLEVENKVNNPVQKGNEEKEQIQKQVRQPNKNVSNPSNQPIHSRASRKKNEDNRFSQFFRRK